MYECKYCNFSTELKSNYGKHIRTKKHLENVKNETESINEMKTRINELQNMNNLFINQITSLTTQNESLVQQNRQLINHGFIVMERSQDIIMSLVQAHSRATPFVPITNFDRLMVGYKTNKQKYLFRSLEIS